jgi:hypothetical protein
MNVCLSVSKFQGSTILNLSELLDATWETLAALKVEIA